MSSAVFWASCREEEAASGCQAPPGTSKPQPLPAGQDSPSNQKACLGFF